jgi:3',5'-cyclic AMP phosphodiesterase CpdA
VLAALLQQFTFVVVGHTRGGPGNGVIPTERYDEMVEEFHRIAPDFVVLTGDLVYGDFEAPVVDAVAVQKDWEAVDAQFARLGCPVYRVPGNHDIWDATTRDIWIGRYGALQKSFEHEGSRFLLLNSCWTPAPGKNGVVPGRFIRGAQLEGEALQWVRDEIEASRGAQHVFVFMGHMLWWEDDAAWWKDVHPLLAELPTRAVFAGDLGPWKFSHLERDRIDYVQTAVEFCGPPIVMQRNRESSRAIAEQLDTYAVVRVLGDGARIEIRTLGALTTGEFTPAKFREVHEHDKGTIRRKVFSRMDTPEKLMSWLWKLGCLAFGAGVLATSTAIVLLRRRKA